ncbi:MAG: ASKHA domain-containing protein [Candidatus Sulfobium sp.]
MESPSPSDKTADADRLRDGLEKMGISGVEIPLDIMKRLPCELRRNHFTMKVVIGINRLPRPACQKGEQGEGAGGPGNYGLTVLGIGKDSVFGLALDIGSTNVECSLTDLMTGEKVARASAENPQTGFGVDVLTRAQMSMVGEYGTLNRALLEGMNGLIRKVCDDHGVEVDEIFAFTIAGNTIMSHFAMGLDVRNIPVTPYVPAVNAPVFCRAAEMGLSGNRNAMAYIFPNSGSYVGGDIISGILYSGLHREESPALFIDVGTNVEITLGCRDWIMTGAGAAGPALEGGVAAIGKKAERGTVSRVKFDRLRNKLDLEVIGDTEPAGICGSGMIDLISELFSAGVIDQRGRLVDSAVGVTEREGAKVFMLYKSGTRELYLTEAEIENFLLSKAAMFSFLYVFVKSVGLTFSEIHRVYIAGALGCGIDLESAVNIGMLPDMPRDRFIPLGNSSLGGAEMVLTDRDLLCEIGEIAARITYREMNEDGELMNILQGAMFLPHTEPEILKGGD